MNPDDSSPPHGAFGDDTSDGLGSMPSNRLLSLFRAIDDFFIFEKGSLVAAFLILFILGVSFAHRSKPVIYPLPLLSSGEYRDGMTYLQSGIARLGDRLPKVGTTRLIPIPREPDFSLLVQKLNLDFLRASDGQPTPSQTFVLGGKEMHEIDDVLLQATRRVHLSRSLFRTTPGRVTIVLVAPTRVSEDTRRILEHRGFTVLLAP